MDINKLFWDCVHIMHRASKAIGITYEELNVYLFVFLHPLITLLCILLCLKYWTQYRRLKKKTGYNVTSEHIMNIQQLMK